MEWEKKNVGDIFLSASFYFPVPIKSPPRNFTPQGRDSNKEAQQTSALLPSSPTRYTNADPSRQWHSPSQIPQLILRTLLCLTLWGGKNHSTFSFVSPDTPFSWFIHDMPLAPCYLVFLLLSWSHSTCFSKGFLGSEVGHWLTNVKFRSNHCCPLSSQSLWWYCHSPPPLTPTLYPDRDTGARSKIQNLRA